MSSELWVASDWPAAAVIGPRGPPEGGRWGGQIGLSYPSELYTRERQCRPPYVGFDTPMSPPDVVLVHMKPTLGPARPQLYPGWPLSEPLGCPGTDLRDPQNHA